VVVSEGFAPGWKATGPDGPIPLLRANGRYWALATPGGQRRVDVRFEPSWRAPALALAALGLVTLALMSLPRRRARQS